MNDQLPILFLAFMRGMLVFYGVKKIVDASATSSWPTATATTLAT